ncbi:MAG: sensor histidine kinase [Micrococcales bacterium]|nr:sensor histidine kinase [Micrococcales bacterium]
MTSVMETQQPDQQTPAPQPVDPRPAFAWLGRFFAQTGYLLLTLPIAVVSFTVLITLASLGVGTLVIWIGLLVLAFNMLMAKAFAAVERRRLWAAGVELHVLPPPPDLTKPTKTGLGRWFKRHILSADGWRAWLHGVIALPLSCLTWSLTLAWWFVPLFGLTEWAWRAAIPYDTCIATIGYCDYNGDYRTLMDIINWPMSQVLFDFIMGLVFAVTLPYVMRGLFAMHAGLARGLLQPTNGSLMRRVQDLAESRDQAMAAQTDDLRRIERDIHDGPQQRLIRVGMDLAAAQRRLEAGDAEAAKDLIDQARQFSDEAVEELRALARGIAPPILADRGLGPALEAACAASPVPADLAIDNPDGVRPPDTVATMLYFTATEALANVAKHAAASKVEVCLTLSMAGARLTVHDDGAGGAQVTTGHGLGNLQARARAVDGDFRVESQEGQGTLITVEVANNEGGAG